MEEQNVQIDWDQLRSELVSCPDIPQPPLVEPINPPPYKMPR
jgi:hypothetical protein